jgi:DNA repair exonuclease SbcCD nuclease subunit
MKNFNNNIAIIGDLHLGIHQADTNWHQTSIKYAKWLNKTLKQHNIKDIVFLGDINDNRKVIPVTSLYWLPEFFKVLEDFNIVIIAGNHDCFYNNRSDITSLNVFSGWDNIDIINDITTISKGDKILTFCPWNGDINNIPKCDILFGHFEIASFKMSNFHICEFGVKSSDIIEKAKLTFSGHFHIREERKYNNDKQIIFTGSSYELNWGDLGNTKGIYLLDIDKMSYNFIENKESPKHKIINIQEIINAGKITKDIENEIKNNIISIEVNVEDLKNIQVEQFISEIYNIPAFSIKTNYESSISNTISSGDNVTHIDIKDNIIEFIKVVTPADKESFERLNSDITKYMIDIYERAKNEK